VREKTEFDSLFKKEEEEFLVDNTEDNNKVL
jgi:hypothetical protein